MGNCNSPNAPKQEAVIKEKKVVLDPNIALPPPPQLRKCGFDSLHTNPLVINAIPVNNNNLNNNYTANIVNNNQNNIIINNNNLNNSNNLNNNTINTNNLNKN